jgi:predicted phosphodiesterase
MRVALLADIHGNRIALAAALADIERDRPDQIVCLGDVAATGPQPREVVERGIEARFVMGNADAWLLDPQPSEWEITDEDSRILLEIELWGAQQLSPADLDFLRTFQPTVEVALADGISLLCYHGSPRSNTEAIESRTSDDTLDTILSGYHAAVMAGGHTHTKMLRCHRGSLIVNPGSVGLPIIERGDAKSSG